MQHDLVAVLDELPWRWSGRRRRLRRWRPHRVPRVVGVLAGWQRRRWPSPRRPRPGDAAMYTWSLAWMTVLGSGSTPGAEPHQERHARRRWPPPERVTRWPNQSSCSGISVTATLPGRVAPLGRLGCRRVSTSQHPVGGPRHGGDGRDAEALVDLGALGVVDAGDDPLDAERLAGHPRGDDVGVVAGGHRGERVGPLDARPEQHVAVEAHAESRSPGEVGADSRRNAVASRSMTATSWPTLAQAVATATSRPARTP